MKYSERLEDIKNSSLEGLHILFGTSWVSMPKENFEWLIQQAERAQKNAQDLEDMDRQLYSEQQQNKRYREALKNIYELAEYDEYDNTLEQIVSEIEKALEGDEN